MKKFFGKKIVLCMMVVVLIAIIFVSTRAFSSSQRALELRVEEFFHISLSDENILSWEIQVIDSFGFDFLYAELVIVADKKEEIFGYYLNFTRMTDVSRVPRDIVNRVPSGYEIDYFYDFFRSRQRRFSLFSASPRTHFIVFMQEQNETILVVLFAELGSGQWWG